MQVIELLTFRAFRYGYAFFAPHTGDLQTQEADKSKYRSQHQKTARHRLIVYIQYQRTNHNDDRHKNGTAQTAVTGKRCAVAHIIRHNAGKRTKRHIYTGVQRLIQNIGNKHVGKAQSIGQIAHIDKAQDAQHRHGKRKGPYPWNELSSLCRLAGIHDRTYDRVIDSVPYLCDQHQDTDVERVHL